MRFFADNADLKTPLATSQGVGPTAQEEIRTINAAVDEAQDRPTEFLLTTDGDAHWYVIPANRRAEFDKAIDDFDEIGSLPDWAHPVNSGPSSIRFHSWRQE